MSSPDEDSSLSANNGPIPAPDRHCAGQRVLEEAETHRTLGAGPQRTTVYIGVHVPAGGMAGARGRRKRRRRSHQQNNMAVVSEADESKGTDASAPDPQPGNQSADPTTRVQFLLGNQDDDENGCNQDDAEVHPVFCEMDELCKSDALGEMQWKETARWIKFEEDVEEGGERWSKPHVATRRLFALFEVRNSIYSGEILLDCEGQTMEAISELLLDRLIQKKKLDPEHREKVKDLLLKRHHHLHDKKAKNLGAKIRSFADIGKKYSSKDLEKDAVQPSSGNLKRIESSKADIEQQLDASASIDPTSPCGAGSEMLPTCPSSYRFDQHFMKKIPPGAETSNILVGSTDFLEHPLTAFVRLKTAVVLGDLTEVPVPTRFIYVLLGPPGQGANFHEMGRSMATLMSDEIFHDVAYLAKSKEDLLFGVDEFLKCCTVLPPNEWDPSIRIDPPKEVPSQEIRKQGTVVALPGSSALLGTSASVPAALAAQDPGGAGANSGGNGGGGSGGGNGVPAGETSPSQEEASHVDPSLRITGRLFGGLIDDVKRKAPFYLSDFKDAIHVQTVGAFCFLYFACLTPIITFGGLLVDATEGHLGAIESICSGAICGIIYSLFAGQPLTIMGSTGPVLVFETIVYSFTKERHWDYLAFRLWIGLWIALILLIFVAFDLSALVKYITRFTEESFASLIALIFVVEAFKKLFEIKKAFPIKRDWFPTYTPDLNCSCVFEPRPNATEPKPLPQGQHTRMPSYLDNATGVYYMNYSALDYWSWGQPKYATFCKTYQGKWEGSGCGTYAVPDVFFFSCLLFIGTFVLSYGLKMLRNSMFFPNRVRSIVSDFAVMLAIGSMTGTDALLGLRTPKLIVPSEFSPTLGYEARGWLIKPLGSRGQNPWYTIPLALLPALLATILIFMDQQITAVIVNRKENKMKKSLGYHLDLLIVSILIAVNSILGIPWFVAATVLSINHVMALKIESEATAPGERPKFLGCRENRVTGFLIFLLIGLSVFLTPVLRHIPMPVLYGVFLFMGISSLRGVQLAQRVGLFFMPQKYQPDYKFLRHVKIVQVHKFTIIQIVCLGLLWVIKVITEISILFPIMVLAMCFVRWGLNFLFTQTELRWLDDIMPPIDLCKKRGNGKPNSDVTVEFPMSEHSTALTRGVDDTTVNVSNELDSKEIGGKSKKPGSANPKEREPLLLCTPQIVVQPPSNANTPAVERKLPIV